MIRKDDWGFSPWTGEALTDTILGRCLKSFRVTSIPSPSGSPQHTLALCMLVEDSFIYIIDDDAASRRSVEALVEPMGASIHTYASADSFLQDYRDERPGCIITDQRMPGTSGIQLLEYLRLNGISLSVVIITAYPDTRSTVRAMRQGAVSLLEKPCNPQELWDTVQLALREDAKNAAQELSVRDAKARLESLSEGEREVLNLLVSGQTNKVIAARIRVSLRTVESRRAAVFEKLGAKSVAEVTRIWIRATAKP